MKQIISENLEGKRQRLFQKLAHFERERKILSIDIRQNSNLVVQNSMLDNEQPDEMADLADLTKLTSEVGAIDAIIADLKNQIAETDSQIVFHKQSEQRAEMRAKMLTVASESREAADEFESIFREFENHAKALALRGLQTKSKLTNLSNEFYKLVLTEIQILNSREHFSEAEKRKTELFDELKKLGADLSVVRSEAISNSRAIVDFHNGWKMPNDLIFSGLFLMAIGKLFDQMEREQQQNESSKKNAPSGRSSGLFLVKSAKKKIEKNSEVENV